ncbi:hypothetical protein [Caenimonas koreensis]|uniref:hypothetical protein n=1 Tax=Caenimonas koreensis TaxID=367474 RepID=UPI0037847E72
MSAAKLIQGYEVVIGFETHAQLSTQSKIFSRAPRQTDPGLRSRHRLRDARATLDPVKNLQPRAHCIRR